MDTQLRRLPRLVAAGAIAAGLAAGSYGIAAAATGPASSSQSSLGTLAQSLAASSSQGTRQPWGVQRSDETALTGDTGAKVRAAAVAKLPGATVVRVETDADGHAAYEAHMVEADGTLATVYVDRQFAVTAVETGMPGGAPRAQA